MVSIVVQGCDSFDKNLNQRPFVYIRYTDERYEKALKGVEIFLSPVSMSRRYKKLQDHGCDKGK